MNSIFDIFLWIDIYDNIGNYNYEFNCCKLISFIWQSILRLICQNHYFSWGWWKFLDWCLFFPLVISSLRGFDGCWWSHSWIIFGWVWMQVRWTHPSLRFALFHASWEQVWIGTAPGLMLCFYSNDRRLFSWTWGLCFMS